MAVRVKIRVKSLNSNNEVEVVALVNTGFETEKPQLLIPISLAKQLGLWPPPLDTYIVELFTAGGPVRNYLVLNALEIRLVTEDRVRGPVVCDAIISHIEEEVVINDKLGEELGIVIIGTGSGKWRLIDDPPNTIRYSEKPHYY